MKPLDIHINLTSEDYAALMDGQLHWVDRAANTQRIQTVFLSAPDGRHHKPRRIPAAQAAALAADPQALQDAYQAGRLIPRGRKVVFHKGYSTITKEVSLTGLGLLLGGNPVIHLEVADHVLRSAGTTDARGVEVLSGDTLADNDGNTVGTVSGSALGSAFVITQQAIPLEVFDNRKYIVKL